MMNNENTQQTTEQPKNKDADRSPNGIPWRKIVILTDGNINLLQNAEVFSAIEFIGILDGMKRAIDKGDIRIRPVIMTSETSDPIKEKIHDDNQSDKNDHDETKLPSEK